MPPASPTRPQQTSTILPSLTRPGEDHTGSIDATVVLERFRLRQTQLSLYAEGRAVSSGSMKLENALTAPSLRFRCNPLCAQKRSMGCLIGEGTHVARRTQTDHNCLRQIVESKVALADEIRVARKEIVSDGYEMSVGELIKDRKSV